VDASNAFPVNLTNNPAEDYTPLWSPDGSRIAFFSTRTGWLEIYVMNADGSNITQLTDTKGTNSVYVYPISWSPDGKQILAVKNEAWYVGRPSPPRTLDVIQSDGSGVTTLYQSEEAYISEPSWSPDGSYIAALVYGRSIVGGVHVGKTGESPFNLSSPNYFSNCWNYGWSPDGKLTCFSGGEIFAVNADGSDRNSLVGVRNGYVSDAAWSPDGKLLLYMGNIFTSASTIPGLKPHVANADGSEQWELPLDSEPAEIGVPSWSPDSQWIAYSAKAGEQFNIYLVNVYDTYQHAQLTINAGDNFSPQWQP
jgi:Tol biopolymer transport system component